MKLDMTRRQAIMVGVQAVGVMALPFVVEAGEGLEQREHKPVTRESLVKSLIALAVKAKGDGLGEEAKLLMKTAKELM